MTKTKQKKCMKNNLESKYQKFYKNTENPNQI